MEERFPFDVVEDNSPVATVVFHPDCTMERSLASDKQLEALLGRCSHLVIDLGQNTVISSHWVRLFALLTIRAKRFKKRVSLRGASPEFHDIADQLALDDKFEYINP